MAEVVALVDELAHEIQARMMSGTIAIGSWLRQESLAADFGVSRTPVREALRKLQASGVVEVVPHPGALVRGPTVREIREAYEVRAELEGFAAELAARWIHTEQMGRLREAEELFRKAVADLSAAPKARGGSSDETDGTRGSKPICSSTKSCRRLVATINFGRQYESSTVVSRAI
jgi:DNA-binding GntR family transcriptional regulator